MAEHTKWEIMPYTRRDGDNIRWVKDERNKAICQTFKPHAEAHARLIAAAPKTAQQRDDLLDACENLRGFLLTQHLAEVRAKENYACPKSCATCYLLNQGLAAIAKAQSNTSVQPISSSSEQER